VRPLPGPLKFNEMKAMLLEESGRDTGGAGHAAGGAAALEQNGGHPLAAGEEEGLFGPFDKLPADIHAVPVYDPGLSREDRMAVAMGQCRRGSGSGEAAHLFGTEGDPQAIFQILTALPIGLTLTVVTAAQPDKTGADQVNRWVLCGHDRPETG
jgi:hypothetical protein